MQHTKELLVKLANWKEKAIARRKRINRYEVQLKRSSQRCKAWRQEALSLRVSLREAERALARHQKAEEAQRDYPRRHQYSSWLMSLALVIRLLGPCSLRGSIKILSQLVEMGLIGEALPAYTSLSNWEKKLGLYHLSSNRETEQLSTTPIIVVDESMYLGQQSVLAVLGVAPGASHGAAPSMSEVSVLHLESRPSWKGEEMAQCLQSLGLPAQSLPYAVSDGGTALKKAFELSGITRVEDCTHVFGGLLEKHYKDLEAFEKFRKAAALLRTRLSMSQYSSYQPPAQRRKGRFLNLFPLAQWGKNLLDQMSNDPQSFAPKLWAKIQELEAFRPLVNQLFEVTQTVHQISKPLKEKGLSDQSAEQVRQILRQGSLPDWFTQGVEAYLQRNLLKAKTGQSLLCTSDIIESFFSLLKLRLQMAPTNTITESLLVMAQTSRPIKPQTVHKAMEQTKIKDLTQWRNLFIHPPQTKEAA